MSTNIEKKFLKMLENVENVEKCWMLIILPKMLKCWKMLVQKLMFLTQIILFFDKEF